MPELISTQLDFRGVLDALGDAVVAANAEGRIVYVNAATERLLGWCASDLVGQPVTVLIPPRLRGAHLAAFHRYVTTRVPRLIGHPTRVSALHRDGGEIEIELNLATLPAGQGEEVIVASLRDLGERVELEQTGDRLRHQLAFMGAITASLGEGVYALDREGRVTFMNPAAERLLGWTEEELLGKDMHEMIHFQRADGMHVPKEHCPLLEVARSGVTRRVDDDVFTRKDGMMVPVSYTSSPIVSDGKVVGTVLAFHDMSEFERVEAERDRARAAAEAQWAHLHSLFMRAPAIIASYRGPDHVHELVNPRYIQIFGDRNFIGRPAREVVPEIDGQGIFEILDRVYTSGDPFIGREMPIDIDRHSNGRPGTGFFNVVMQPTFDSRGTVDGVLLHAVEVTEEVMARRRAEHLAGEQAAILGQIAEGIIMADRDGNVTYVNEAGQRILGVSSIGVPLSEHSSVYHTHRLDGTPYPPEELPLSRAVLHGETVLGSSLAIHRPDGTRCILEANAAPVFAEDGTQLGAVATFRDVTAQYDVERQKDEFLSTAAHDLKTPLTTIKGTAQLLRRRAARESPPDLEQLRKGLEQIDRTSVRMGAMIDELLDISRIQMGQLLDLKRRPVDLIELIARIVTDHEESTGHRRIHVDARASRLVGDWDVTRLDRVLSNLVSNAIKYSPEGDDITIKLSREDADGLSWAVVSISDRGLGIPADDVPHIFERFHRGRNVVGRIPGNGIGLAGARQIVEQHGGRISVESREGAGSTFTVRLPLSD